jgi:putative colanic acid biosynthesis UDP-glucose lipid carrier transferase
MTSPVVFKSSMTIGTLTAAQALLPPAIAVSLLAAETLLLGVRFTNDYAVLAGIIAVLSAVLMQPKRAVTPQLISGRHQMVVRIIVRWMILFFCLLAIGYATKTSDEFSRRVVLSWALITPALLIVVRLATHDALVQELSNPQNARRAVFVGYNEISLALAERIEANSAAGLIADGFFDDRSPERLRPVPYAKMHGGLQNLVSYVKERAIDVIFVALPISHLSRVKRLLEDLRDTTVSIYYAPTIFPFDAIQSGANEFLGMPLIALCETPFHGYRGVGKRLTDIALAGLILIGATPLMLVIATLIKLTSPGPVLFKQHRYGLDGRRIVIYKFRSMYVMQDGDVVPQATTNDARVTRVGRLLRRTSLDELPQLINVLQGRMSLVGPRPHAVAHNELYRKLIKGYMVRHKVTPGITGLAQIHGLRGETRDVRQMEARLQYDLEYIRNWSPLLDFKILLKTLAILVRFDRAY